MLRTLAARRSFAKKLNTENAGAPCAPRVPSPPRWFDRPPFPSRRARLIFQPCRKNSRLRTDGMKKTRRPVSMSMTMFGLRMALYVLKPQNRLPPPTTQMRYPGDALICFNCVQGVVVDLRPPEKIAAVKLPFGTAYMQVGKHLQHVASQSTPIRRTKRHQLTDRDPADHRCCRLGGRRLRDVITRLQGETREDHAHISAWRK